MSASTSRRRKLPWFPAADETGHIPTLNNQGWMTSQIGPVAAQFIEEASSKRGWVLDIGCAFGIHSLAILNKGGRVVANDLDDNHLRVLAANVPPSQRLNLRLRRGAFPNIKIPAGSCDAVFASAVMHFMDGPTVDKAIRKMFTVLRSEGKVYVTTTTPYTSIAQALIPDYERRKAAGEKWPGLVRNWHEVPGTTGRVTGLLHRMDPDILSRAFEDHGFKIELAKFIQGKVPAHHLDGREAAVLVARKA